MSNKVSKEIAVIQKISYAVIHERNVNALLNNVLKILDSEMGMLLGTFTLRYGDILKIEASIGLDETEKNLGQYRIGEGITGHVAERGCSHVIPDLRKDSRFLNRTKSRHYDNQVAFICVPLIHEEKIIGTLSIDRPVDYSSDLDRDVALLEIVANITAEAAYECIEIHKENEALLEENKKLREMLEGTHTSIIGNCSEMQLVYEQIQQVATSDATVLIRGSSGTGKEMVARAIVNLSERKSKPFVALNCAAIPENLLESELFGHEKGAFTGASNRRIGRAEAADGGTLFLDEIGDLTLPMQVKLLRFLQEKTFSRVGSNEELQSNVRFLAATSRNLEELMEKKLFREDLYYRLNIFPIVVPDLAKRHNDIILLAEHFIEKMNLKYNKKVTHLSPVAINMLMSYHWPGNVRELENFMERAVLTAKDDCIHSYNLPTFLQNSLKINPGTEEGEARPTVDILLENYEREIFTEAIKRSDGNLSAAGRELGLSPRMMNYRMNKLKLNSKKN